MDTGIAVTLVIAGASGFSGIVVSLIRRADERAKAALTNPSALVEAAALNKEVVATLRHHIDYLEAIVEDTRRECDSLRQVQTDSLEASRRKDARIFALETRAQRVERIAQDLRQWCEQQGLIVPAHLTIQREGSP